MKLFDKVFGKDKRIFNKADLSETKNVLVNPARGWYQLFTFPIDEEPDFTKSRQCLVHNESLVLVVIDIGSVRSRDLMEAEIQRIKDILGFFRDAGKDVILRICYDHLGRAMEREPSFFTQVINHLTELESIFVEFKDTIFVYQGMLIGNWGEMHTSKFLGMEQLDKMADILKKHKGDATYLAVRCPVQWRSIHKKNSVDIMKNSGMGLFDDAIFGSVTDLGTFGQNSKEMVGWNNSWTREEELDFEYNLCKWVPNGGEVVFGEGYSSRISQADLIDAMRRMHLTYLNRLYDRTILDAWEKQSYNGKGIWTGESLYDYIGAHLGYRFHIKNVKLVPATGVNADEYLSLEMEVENLGFANIYQEAELCIDWTDENGRTNSKVLDEDMRNWNSGASHKFNCHIKSGKGNVYLSAKRKSDNAKIYFANVSDLTGRVLLGNLL